jgi:acyl-CoA dehydrogenase
MEDQISDSLGRLLAAECTPQLIRNVESGASPSALWSLLERSGYADALVPDEAGGSGVGLSAAFELLVLCGFYAVPVPLASTMLARALLVGAGLKPDGGSITFASAAMQPDGGIRCSNTAWGRVADWVLVETGDHARLLPAAAASTCTFGVFALDSEMAWDSDAVAQAETFRTFARLDVVHACGLAALICGALDRVMGLTLSYANERQQFGRAIGKFQAIQHQLSVMAEHAAAARMAAQIGCQGSVVAPHPARVAVAKGRTGQAALEVASLAHSIHGAIGFTAEYDLQIFTRRLHAWRQAAGSESLWHRELGGALLSAEGGTLDFVRFITDATERPKDLHELPEENT